MTGYCRHGMLPGRCDRIGCDKAPKCDTCEYCALDQYVDLPIKDRSGVCSKIGEALDIEVDCQAYCYGGTVNHKSIELESLDFSCSLYKEKS